MDEYYQKMQVLMIGTNVHESDDATMTRFFEGLNEDIRDRVDLMQYNDMQELLHQAECAKQWVMAIKFPRVAPISARGGDPIHMMMTMSSQVHPIGQLPPITRR